MKLEAGKYYIDRGGVKVGPIEAYDGDGFSFRCKGSTYNSYGGYFSFCESSKDLILECVDECGEPSHEGPSKRAKILDKAKEYVTKDRNATHGEPEDTFGVIAGLWSAYLGAEVSPADVCNLMVLLKVSRAKANPKHLDSFVDICGYAACGGEISGNEHGQEV